MERFVRYHDFRITVLTSCLFRIEESPAGKFHEELTQLVASRDFPDVPFRAFEKSKKLVLKTAGAELHFTGALKTSYFLEKKRKLYLNNKSNLGGTYSNLDGMDGAVLRYGNAESRPGLGVCSRTGVSILDDSASYCLDKDGKVTFRNPDRKDCYVFFFPNLYEEAVKTFFRLSGYSPRLPRYAFGNWWSRFYNYTQESYLYQMTTFAQENVPFTVATIDMNWHPSNTNGRNFFKDVGKSVKEFYYRDKDGKQVSYCQGFGDPKDWIIGWTGYSFNKPLFPDYRQFFKDLHGLGLAITLNLHPANGIGFFEDQYLACCQDLGIDPKEKKSIPFNVLDPKLLKDYETNILHPYEKDGVDFWWYDWQQGSQSSLPGLNMLWALNHTLYRDRASQTDQPLILSRNCGLGGQRYPIGFSGDTFQTFATLAYLIKTTSMASNIGFPYWSHDIGGHQQGEKNGDLYLKFVQFAVFSPILRLHCSSEEMLSKDPDLFLGGYGELVKKYLRLRHQLIPFLDSENQKIHTSGIPLLRPLYYAYPNDRQAYAFADREYFFGPDLLVAPLRTSEEAEGFTSERIYLPQGEFYDPIHGYHYQGRRILTVYRQRGEMPLFLRKGAFFLQDSSREGNSLAFPKELSLTTTLGQGSYDLVEAEKGQELITHFINETASSQGRMSLTFSGSPVSFQPERIYQISLLNVFTLPKLSLTGGTLIKATAVSGHLVLTLKAKDFKTPVILTLTAPTSGMTQLKHDLGERLRYLDGPNANRIRLYQDIQKAKSGKALRSLIQESGLSELARKALTELL